MVTKLITIEGKVQGVGFRAFAKHVANSLGLTGYAKNLPNGNVEILLSGPNQQVLQAIDMLSKGPPSARITNVRISEDCRRADNFIIA